MTTRQFYTKWLFLSAILALIAYLAQEKYAISFLIWAAFVYHALLALVTYYIANSGIKKDNKTFVTRIYGSIGIRFVFSIFPMLIYLLFSNVKEIPWVISYVLLYFFYTSFEIYCIVVNLRPDLKQNNS